MPPITYVIIPPHLSRVSHLNDVKPPPNPPAILYWMQAAMRPLDNPALNLALSRAASAACPLIVVITLPDPTPVPATARHLTFAMEGVCAAVDTLQAPALGIRCLVALPPATPPAGGGSTAAARVAAVAAMLKAHTVVADVSYLRPHRRDVAELTRLCAATGVELLQVETECVVPVAVASDKVEVGARTLRPRVERELARFLTHDPTVGCLPALAASDPCRSCPLPPALLAAVSPAAQAAAGVALLEEGGDAGGGRLPTAAALVRRLGADPAVPPPPHAKGGWLEAYRACAAFVATRLPAYRAARSNPAAAGTSRLSAALAHGHISPTVAALAALGALRTTPVPPGPAPVAVEVQVGDAGEGAAAFLEEVVVRRELAHNMCHHDVGGYDSYAGAVPSWAQLSLAKHAADKRPESYPERLLEAPATWRGTRRSWSWRCAGGCTGTCACTGARSCWSGRPPPPPPSRRRSASTPPTRSTPRAPARTRGWRGCSAATTARGLTGRSSGTFAAWWPPASRASSAPTSPPTSRRWRRRWRRTACRRPWRRSASHPAWGRPGR